MPEVCRNCSCETSWMARVVESRNRNVRSVGTSRREERHKLSVNVKLAKGKEGKTCLTTMTRKHRGPSFVRRRQRKKCCVHANALCIVA